MPDCLAAVAGDVNRTMIKVLLWDVDGTLLNFEKSEKHAIRTCFSLFGLGECTDEMIARYSEINQSYWKRLEKGELSKPEVLLGRFREFFALEGIHTDQVESFNGEYQLRLGDTIFFNDNGYELVKELKGRIKQYAVTNGTQIAQKRKLKKSGLSQLLDGAFISDEIGVEKPGIGFFDKVFKQIGSYEKDEILIVGDSLTSDIRGGNNAGILCCWYNPSGQERNTSLRIDYEVENLEQIRNIL